MKKEFIIGIIIVVLIIATVGYFMIPKQPSVNTNNNVNTNTNPGTSSNEILIQNFAFSPSTLTIKVGDSVTWKNQDSASHTIVSDSGSEISSSSLSNGGIYTHTFSIAGTYNYHCSIHPSMKGKVVVQ